MDGSAQCRSRNCRCTGAAADIDEPEQKISDEEYLAFLAAALERLDALEEELDQQSSADEEDVIADVDAMDIDEEVVWPARPAQDDHQQEEKQSVVPQQRRERRVPRHVDVVVNARSLAPPTVRIPRLPELSGRLASLEEFDPASSSDEDSSTIGPLEYEIDTSSVAERVGRRVMAEAQNEERMRSALAARGWTQAALSSRLQPGYMNGQVDLKQKKRELDAALKKIKKRAVKKVLDE